MKALSKDRLAGVRRALGKAHRLPDDLPDRLADLEQRLADAERELIRLAPQVAALEARLEDLVAGLDRTPLEATDAEQTEARSLLEEVRTEHARVRARITAATVFEERLRVVEDKLGD